MEPIKSSPKGTTLEPIKESQKGTTMEPINSLLQQPGPNKFKLFRIDLLAKKFKSSPIGYLSHSRKVGDSLFANPKAKGSQVLLRGGGGGGTFPNHNNNS